MVLLASRLFEKHCDVFIAVQVSDQNVAIEEHGVPIHLSSFVDM